MLLEELGAHIEAGWDNLIGSRHMREWYWYLKQDPDPEPIAYRYIRSLVLRLKFLLASYASLLIGLPGFTVLLLTLPNCLISYLYVLGLSLLGYCLRREAQEVHYILSSTRRDLATAARLGSSPKPSFYVYDDYERKVRGVITKTLIILLPLTVFSYFWRDFPVTLLTFLFDKRVVRFFSDPGKRAAIVATICCLVLVVLLTRSSLASGAFELLVEGFRDYRKRKQVPSIFRLDIECQTEGSESVIVVGNIPELGNWDPDNGLVLHPGSRDTEGCIWRGILRTNQKSFEFKLFQKSDGDRLWESGPNRTINLHDQREALEAQFRL